MNFMEVIIAISMISVSCIGFSFAVIVVLEKLVTKFIGKNDLEDERIDFWSSMSAFGVFLGAVVLVWISAWFLIPWWMGKDPKSLGEAGDMFGGITALFSGLAFAGLISTLLMQRRELELQRKELRLSRDEFGLQRFENTFFGLVKLFNDHVDSLSGNPTQYVGDTSVYKGRAYLENCADGLADQFFMGTEGPKHNPRPIPAERSIGAQIKEYENAYDLRYESDLGPYFRLLYNTIRHIEKSGLTEEEKLDYSKIVRAYLSSSEVKLLMFNCASRHGSGMKQWVVKHRFLKHLHPKMAGKNVALVATYPAQAFDDRNRIIKAKPIPATP